MRAGEQKVIAGLERQEASGVQAGEAAEWLSDERRADQ